MTTILLAPHGDDETLFAAYTCMRERAHVIICTQDSDVDVRDVRSGETARAMDILGCFHHEWPMPADRFDISLARVWLSAWSDKTDRVFAPAVDVNGHEQHNLIGNLAKDIFGERVVSYMTYAPRGRRQRQGAEVIPHPEEIQCKLNALSSYRTQIDNPLTRPWFFDLLDLREWVDG